MKVGRKEVSKERTNEYKKNQCGMWIGRKDRPERRALCSQLFITEVELISRKTCTSDTPRQLQYAGDLAIAADEDGDLQQEQLT